MGHQHVPGKAGLHAEQLQIVFHVHGVAHLAKQFRAALGVFGAPLLSFQIVLQAQALHAKGGGRHGPNRLKSVQTPLADEFVRVKPVGEKQYLGGYVFRFKDFKAPLDGVLARLVPVVGQVYLRGEPFQQPGLLVGERRAKGRHRADHARLTDGHHVHISFHQQDAFQVPLFPDQVDGVYALALVEHRRVGSVQVLGLCVVQGAPAEAQYVSVLIYNGKHGAAAEHIVGAFAFDNGEAR